MKVQKFERIITECCSPEWQANYYKPTKNAEYFCAKCKNQVRNNGGKWLNNEKETQKLHYDFYLENCVADDEEPLKFKEWVENYFEENLQFCKERGIEL